MNAEGLHAAAGLIEHAPAGPAGSRDLKGPIPVCRAPLGKDRSAAAPDRTAAIAAEPPSAGTAGHEAAPTSGVGRRRKLRRAGAGWVQEELSLSAVRVVRNDLHGADLEFVLRGEPETRQLTLRPQIPRAQAVGGGWRGWLAHWRQWFRARR
jgi:hypothetical protein